MTPEEFERLKAKEREHLEKMRELKKAVKDLERQRSVVSSLEQMRSGAHDLLEQQTRNVEDLARQTAFLEAKSDLAMTSADSADTLDEDELRKLKAQLLVEQIKNEEKLTSEGKPETSSPDTSDPESPAELPDKTIGRMR